MGGGGGETSLGTELPDLDYISHLPDTDRWGIVVQTQEAPASLVPWHHRPWRVPNRRCYIASRDGRRRRRHACGKPPQGVAAVSRAATRGRVMLSLQATPASKRVCHNRARCHSKRAGSGTWTHRSRRTSLSHWPLCTALLSIVIMELPRPDLRQEAHPLCSGSASEDPTCRTQPRIASTC